MRLEKDMDNTQIQNQDIKDKSFHVLLESYRLADAQLEMRIQQRDNLGIQLMVAFGVVLSAFTALIETNIDDRSNNIAIEILKSDFSSFLINIYSPLLYYYFFKIIDYLIFKINTLKIHSL